MLDLDVQYAQLIANCFADSPLPPSLDTPLADLALDSLGLLDFMLQLEEMMGCAVSVEDVDEKMTLGEIFRRLSAKRSME